MKTKKLINIFIIFMFCILNTACSNFGRKMKSLVSGKPYQENVAVNNRKSFNKNGNYGVEGAPRNYRRMTRDKLEAENQIASNTGSLWIMEGQSAYLFSQNKRRLVGDIINVGIEDQANKQLQTKVNVVSRLMKDKEDAYRRKLAAASSKQKSKTAAPPVAAPKDKKDDKESKFNVKEVPTNIVETFPNGSFRVRGSRSFMIGKKEYKVIVTGVIRPEDLADNRIGSNKMLDPKFDIVSPKRRY